MLTRLHFLNIVSKFNPALPLLACLLKIILNTIFSFTPTFPKPFLSLSLPDENVAMHTIGFFDEINKTILSLVTSSLFAFIKRVFVNFAIR